jgi:hypothetical protein
LISQLLATGKTLQRKWWWTWFLTQTGISGNNVDLLWRRVHLLVFSSCPYRTGLGNGQYWYSMSFWCIEKSVHVLAHLMDGILWGHS